MKIINFWFLHIFLSDLTAAKISTEEWFEITTCGEIKINKCFKVIDKSLTLKFYCKN
jgi:hypothetical protein